MAVRPDWLKLDQGLPTIRGVRGELPPNHHLTPPVCSTDSVKGPQDDNEMSNHNDFDIPLFEWTP